MYIGSLYWSRTWQTFMDDPITVIFIDDLIIFLGIISSVDVKDDFTN